MNGGKRVGWDLQRVPQTFLPHLLQRFVPQDTPRDALIELTVIVDGERIPVREFAMYLALIDRLYGRLSPGGLKSYAHREFGHLEIAEVHKSELEIIFRQLYENFNSVSLIVIMLFLKGLPKMFKVTTEGVKNLAEAYKAYQEGTVFRERIGDNAAVERRHSADRRVEKRHDDEDRRTRNPPSQFIEVIEQEPALAKLPTQEKDRLVALLDALVVEESLNLPTPIRFARRQVKEVILRIRKPRSL